MLSSISALNAQSPVYSLIKTVIGGEGGWDYLSVDSQNKRLYVSHATQVEVLHSETHKKIGVVANLQAARKMSAATRGSS